MFKVCLEIIFVVSCCGWVTKKETVELFNSNNINSFFYTFAASRRIGTLS